MKESFETRNSTNIFKDGCYKGWLAYIWPNAWKLRKETGGNSRAECISISFKCVNMVLKLDQFAPTSQLYIIVTSETITIFLLPHFGITILLIVWMLIWKHKSIGLRLLKF